MRETLRRNATLIALLAGVAVLGVASGYVSVNTDRPSTASERAPAAALKGVVLSAAADRFEVATEAGSRTLRLDGQTAFEALRPAPREAVRPGDWLNVGAAPHAQTLFVITAVVLIPQALLQGPR